MREMRLRGKKMREMRFREEKEEGNETQREKMREMRLRGKRLEK